MNKRYRLQLATKRAFSRNPSGGWKAARAAGLTWCRVMWPNEFEWPHDFVRPSQRHSWSAP